MTGERVWWLWEGPAIADMGEGLLLLEEDKVLNPLSRKNQSAEQSGEQPAMMRLMPVLCVVLCATIQVTISQCESVLPHICLLETF